MSVLGLIALDCFEWSHSLLYQPMRWKEIQVPPPPTRAPNASSSGVWRPSASLAQNTARKEQERDQPPRAEDVSQADGGAGDAGRVQGEVAHGRERHEAQRGQRVGEERGPELRRPAEQGDDHEGRRVQRRDDPQGPDPLGARDRARVAHLARPGEVGEVEQREPAGQRRRRARPKANPSPRRPRPLRRGRAGRRGAEGGLPLRRIRPA